MRVKTRQVSASGLEVSISSRRKAKCLRQGVSRLVLSTSEIQEAALALYKENGYRLLREETADAASNKTIGSGIRRYYFEKVLDMADPEGIRYMQTLVEGAREYVRHTAVRRSDQFTTHQHGEANHLAWLERPFTEALRALDERDRE